MYFSFLFILPCLSKHAIHCGRDGLIRIACTETHTAHAKSVETRFFDPHEQTTNNRGLKISANGKLIGLHEMQFFAKVLLRSKEK